MSDQVQATNDTAQAAADAAASSANAAANSAAAAAAAPTPANMPQQQSQGATPNSVDQLPDWAQNMVRELRDENAKHRNKAKTAAEEATQREQAARDELVQNIAKALGLADSEPDPAQLLEAANTKTAEQEKHIADLTKQLNTFRRDAAITDAIGDRRVNTNLLKAALHMDNAYQQVDPTSDNFTDQVSEAVNRVLEANPELVQATRGKSGVDSNTTQNGSDPITRDDLKTMSAEDINKAVREGRLDHLMKR